MSDETGTYMTVHDPAWVARCRAAAAAWQNKIPMDFETIHLCVCGAEITGTVRHPEGVKPEAHPPHLFARIADHKEWFCRPHGENG